MSPRAEPTIVALTPGTGWRAVHIWDWSEKPKWSVSDVACFAADTVGNIEAYVAEECMLTPFSGSGAWLLVGPNEELPTDAECMLAWEQFRNEYRQRRAAARVEGQ